MADGSLMRGASFGIQSEWAELEALQQYKVVAASSMNASMNAGEHVSTNEMNDNMNQNSNSTIHNVHSHHNANSLQFANLNRSSSLASSLPLLSASHSLAANPTYTMAFTGAMTSALDFNSNLPQIQQQHSLGMNASMNTNINVSSYPSPLPSDLSSPFSPLPIVSEASLSLSPTSEVSSSASPSSPSPSDAMESPAPIANPLKRRLPSSSSSSSAAASESSSSRSSSALSSSSLSSTASLSASSALSGSKTAKANTSNRDSEVAEAVVLSTARIPLHSRARLDSQRKYDIKRRGAARTLLCEMRVTLKTAESIAEQAQKLLRETEPPSISHTAASQLKTVQMKLEDDADEDSCVEEDDDDDAADDDSDENGRRKKAKKTKRSVKPVESLPVYKLLDKASDVIRSLNAMKDQLKRRLRSVDGANAAVGAAVQEDSAAKVVEDLEDEEKFALLLPEGSNKVDELSARLRMLSKRRRLFGDASELTDTDTLLHVIQLITRRYLADVDALRKLENRLPRMLNDLASVFEEYGVMGLNGKIHSLIKFREGSDFQMCFSIASSAMRLGLNFLDLFREPRTTQLHALAHLLSKRFRYREEKAVLPLKSTTIAELHEERPPLALDAALQMVYDARNAPPFLPRGQPQKQRLDTYSLHTQHSSASSTATFPSPHAPSSSASYSSFPSSADSFSVGGEVLNDAECEAALLSHPLGEYSLPRSSFQALQEVLTFLVGLGEEEYERLITLFRPLFDSTFPSICPNNDHEPFMQITAKSPKLRMRETVFGPLFSPTYEQMVGYYQLYCEEKPVVTFRAEIMCSPTNKVLYMDCDQILVRCPNTGLPVAHLVLPRKFIFGDEEFSSLADVFQVPRKDWKFLQNHLQWHTAVYQSASTPQYTKQATTLRLPGGH